MTKNYTPEGVQTALIEIGIKPGDVVNIHSSFSAPGRFVSLDGSNPVKKLISVILEYLGEDGTLVAPAFNFDFCKGETFNRQQTRSKNMGIISETIRTWKGSQRSPHPMQSVAAIGKFAVDICQRDTPSAFGIGGSFDRMLELDAKLLLFGVSFDAASFAHYAGERLQVPYRHWKTFRAGYQDKNILQEREYKMFVRDLNLNPQFDETLLESRMKEQDKLKEVQLGSGKILSCTFLDLYNTETAMLKKDPFCFVEKS